MTASGLPSGPQRERWLLVALVAAAMLRVLVLAAGFPFFHQVDEHQHVDSVVRWSRLELPGPEMSRLGPEVVEWSLRFGTFEYLEPGPHHLPPYLARPGAGGSALTAQARSAFASVVNQEFDSPPSYYATAGAWLRIGQGLGLEGLDLLFWLRALNAVVLGLLVAGSHLWLRRRHPDEPLLHWGAPAVLAFLPQDAFYGVTSDAFCAGVGALAFALAVEAARPGTRSLGADLAAGLAAAAAFLAKYTNLVFFGVAALAYAARAALRREPPPRLALRTGLYAAAAALPVAAWLARNHAVLGDALGTARKVAHLEWTPLPWSELLAHPIFRPWGLAEWGPAVLAHLWRGEFRWHGEPLTFAWLDVFYAAGTAAVLVAAAISAWRAARRREALEPLALAAVGASFAVLAVLSARFEYADWGNPTRLSPYFVEARLVLGAMLPFAIVFVRGLETLGHALAGPTSGPRLAAGLLAGWLVLATATDFALAADALQSPWNWLYGR